MKTNSLFLSFLSGLFLLFAAPVSGLAQELTCGVLIKPELDTSQLATWMLPFQDRFGNRYRPSDLILPALGGGPEEFPDCGCADVGVTTAPFDLWFEDCEFETGVGFDDLAEGAVRRFELCRIFEELNGILAMVVDPCGGETPTINVRVMPSIAIPGYFANGQDLPAMDMEVLGLASSYFGVDQQGILDGMVWEIINSGQVSYEYSGFFHGLLRFNFDPAIAVPWHASFNPLDLPMNNEFDLYSVAYHEAFHMLGFASFLVNSDNGNFAPPATMAFHRYDRFLTVEPGGVPLILNNNPPSFDWSLNPAVVVNDLYNSCDDPLTDPDVCFSSGGVCYPVFTGDPGSPNAFSHLNIDCDGVASAEFLMNPTLPNGVRRTPTAEEWQILCSLGYTLSVGETDCGCDLAAADDWGSDCEDGFSIPFCQCLEFSKADLLGNDSPNAIDVVIQANNPLTGQLTQTGDNFLYCPNRPGLHTLKYFPIGCGGQEGNTAFVFIEALADSDLCPELLECNTPLPACDDLMGFQHCHQSPPCEFPGPGCDQFCNGHICGTVYSNSTLPAGLLDYPYFPAGNSLSTANSKAVVPNWYRSHGSPDLFLTGGSPGIRISGGGGLNDPADGFTEGVFSMADFGEGPYLLGFAFDPAGFAPNLLRVSAIHGGNLTPVPWEQSQAVADYNGVGPVEVLDLTYFTNMPASRAGACFEVDDSAYDALWFWVDPVFGETNSPVQLSDVELMPDDFSAGDDVVSPMCGDPVILGGRFCMLTGLEVTYTWLENGQPIAQYSVLNDQATVLFGNIDPQDHTLTIFPASTTSFVLTREITDFGLYDPDIEFCTIDDKVNVEVSVATPTPGFTYQIEDCQTIVAFQATPDSDPGAVYSWDFGDGSTSSLSSPTHQYLDFGPFTVTLIVENSCGMASYSEEILLSPCLQDCTCEGQFFGDFIGNTLLSQTSLPAQASNGILQMGGGCLQIGGIFVIDQDFEFSNGEIFMLPGAEIRVPAQRVLKFTGMHVHGCDALWHTIKVANGAEFWTNEGTLIEDGLYAVSAYNNAGLRINYTDFNRNFLSIFLTGGAHFLFDQEFKGNQFDCTAPLLPSFTGSHLLPFGNELPPIGNWAYTGMWIRNSNQLIDLGSVYVFPQNLNEFRRLANGVVADDFNLLHIRQTRFYDMKEDGLYPITGYGVRAEGNGAETLRFEGLGLESAPEPPLALTGTILPTIEKAAVGVFTTGVNLEIEMSKVVDCEKGLAASQEAIESISIHNNQIASRQVGIEVISGLPISWEVAISNNYLETGYQGEAPFRSGVSCLGGADLDPSTPAVAENQIYLLEDGEPGLLTTGIYLAGVKEFTADQNQIFLLNALPFEAEAHGLWLDQCNDLIVSCNQVNGQAYSATDPAKTIGLWVRNTTKENSNPLYSCNIINKCVEGLFFEMPCEGTLLNTTSLMDHTTALRMNETAYFSDLLFPIVQEHHGNRWEENPYDNGAVHEATDPLLIAQSRFLVHTSNPASGFWPDPIATPNLDCPSLPPGACDWFLVDTEGAPLLCEPELDCPGGLLELLEVQTPGDLEMAAKVASGEFFSTTHPEGALWSAQQGLYRELLLRPEGIGLHTAVDSFYLAAANGAIGQLQTVREGLRDLYYPSTVLSDELGQTREAQRSLLDSLGWIDQQLITASGQDSVWLFQQRPRLADSLTALGLRLDSIFAKVADERSLAAQGLAAQNEAIDAPGIQAENERTVNAVFLATLAQGIDTFSQDQASQLKAVAEQCIYDGGQSVTYARNLYRLFDDEAFFDDQVCQSKEKREDKKAIERIVEATPSPFRLFPNPATERLTLLYETPGAPPAAAEAQLCVYSPDGRLRQTRAFIWSGRAIELDLSDYPPGLYWLSLRSERNILFCARFAVQR